MILKVSCMKWFFYITTVIITGIILILLATQDPDGMQIIALSVQGTVARQRQDEGSGVRHKSRYNTPIGERPVQPAGVGGTATADTARLLLTRDVYVAGHAVPHPERCPLLGARLRLAILVASAPSHRRARDAIRLTWGHFAARSDVALAFVLGAPPPSLRAAIGAEDALYGDVVVGRSLDSYSNLTLKTLSMLEWMDTYCPRAPRLLKTDDDMFINVPRLLEFIAAPAQVNVNMTIWGKILRRVFPVRNIRSKYYVPSFQYSGRFFPDFATGPAYLMTADVIRPLLATALNQSYLRLEDVFITGVLAERLGIERILVPEFYNRKMTHSCEVQRVISIHMVQFHEQFELWQSLLYGKRKSAIK